MVMAANVLPMSFAPTALFCVGGLWVTTAADTYGALAVAWNLPTADAASLPGAFAVAWIPLIIDAASLPGAFAVAWIPLTADAVCLMLGRGL